VLLSVGNVNTRVERYAPDECAWLRDYLCFPDSRQPRYRPPDSDGKVRLLNEFVMSFPTGFLPSVAKAAKADGLKVEVVDRRVCPAKIDQNADLAWLRDYQRAAFDALAARGRGIVSVPTGGGKTELFVALARAFACRWLFVAPAADLVVQAAERWEKRNRDDGVDLGPAGVIGSGRWSVGPRFTAATFQTLHAGLKRGDARVLALLKETQGLGVDESHTLPADSYLQVANACQAYYRFGFSGTPLSRGDRRSVLSMATLGPVVYKIPAKPLIEAGVLSLPRVRLATVTQELSAPFDEAYERLVVHSKKRNGRVVKMALGAARPCFVFVEREEHGRVLQKAFAAAGERVDFVHGDIKKVDERKRIARACIARSGILVCTRVFQTGLDFPELASGVNAAGYASVIAVLQRLGRGMRVDKASGKDTFEMYDVLDLGNEYLERHARARKNTYAAQGYETVVEPEAL
jgi:superfamily II DNA or RNA helicase